MKTKIVFSILICLAAASNVDAAAANNTAVKKSITTGNLDRFLSSAVSDFKVTLQEKNERQFGSGIGLNPIEGVQFRVAQNETIQDRKYSLQIKPKGFTQMKLMSSLNSGAGRIERLNSQKAMTDALLERYLAASDFVNSAEALRIWTEIASLRSKRLSMLQAAARSSAARAMDLINQRQKLEEAEVEQGLALSAKQAAVIKLKSLDSSFTEPDAVVSDLPTPTDMLRVISATPSTSFNASLATEEAKRASDSLMYQAAADSRLIEFVELNYDQFNYGKQFGFRVAINLPGFSGGDSAQSEKTRKLVKLEVEAREAQRADQNAQSKARESVARAADLYKAMDALEARPSEARMRRLIQQQDPVLAVTLQEDLLKRNLRRVEVSSKAFESYFSFLATSGTLAARPKTNFLSRDLHELPL